MELPLRLPDHDDLLHRPLPAQGIWWLSKWPEFTLNNMPFLSGPRHGDRYVPPSDLLQRFADIKLALGALVALPIGAALKKDLLDELLWQVTFATGNTQSKFMGRYRSAKMVAAAGLKIERDHVYRRKTLLQELLGPTPSLDRIIARAQCCVVLSADEHRSVSDIDGGRKYSLAGITVYDMCDHTEVDPEALWPAYELE